MIAYESHVLPYKNQYKKIMIPDAKVKKIKDFVSELINHKEKENHHLTDYKSHFKRFYMGTLGEAALEEYLNVDNIIDWSIGTSNDYHRPDLLNLGVKVGIKTVEYGLFPIIFKKSYSPEIIMIKVSDHHVVLCGLAKTEVLNKYQSDELIKDSRLRSRGTKTGFYRFSQLEKFTSLEDLIQLCR